MRQYYYLYKTTNLINGNYYIGVHSSDNPETDPYCGSGTLITRAVAKYGRENFRVEILQYFDTWEDALEGERIAVNEQVLKDPKSYNLTLGGRGVAPDPVLLVDPETKQIIRVSKSKAPQLLERGYTMARRYRMHRNGIETLCPEHLVDQYLADGWQKGPTEDHCKKISADHIGRKHTEEAKEKIRLANTGKIVSEESRRKNREAHLGRTSVHKGTVWLTRGSEVLRANPAEHNIDQLLTGGWIRSNGHKGRLGIEKDGITKFINPEDLETYLAAGWIQKNRSAPLPREQRLIYFITDGTIGKKIPAADLDEWLAKGWTIGRPKKKRD